LPDGNSTGLNPAIPGFTIGVTQGTWTVTVTANLGQCTDTEVFEIQVGSRPDFTTCPNNLTVNTAANTCTAVVNYNATPNSIPAPGLAYTFTGATTGSGSGTGSGATFNLGASLVRIIATNACGADTCLFTITVEDKQAPSATCPGNITVSCNLPPNPASVSASDNCTVQSVEFVNDVFLDPPSACMTGRRVERTYKVTDGSGNTSTCSHQVTLIDNTAPVFSFVPANVTVQCNSMPAPGTPVATDNCGGSISITYSGQTVSGITCLNAYTLTRQWTATDPCGNTRTATQRITVIDTQKPAFLNPPANITVQCDAIPVATLPTATDNCDTEVAITYIGQTKTNGACPNAYTLTRRWVAADNCNNTISISQRISVVDNGKPALTIPSNVTIACNEPIPPVGTPTATDNCGGNVTIVYLGQTTANAACPGQYDLRRTWRATDICGNSTAATQIISVQDMAPPTFVSVPQNATIECNQSLPPLGNPVASDACGGYVSITYLGQVRTNGNCLYNYTLTRTWRATDLCGNATTTAQVITVQDTHAPDFVNPPADVTVLCAPDCVPPPLTLVAVDACGSATVTLQENQSSGDCSTGYTVTRTWTATDQCGNTKQHTQVYTVLPAPNFGAPTSDAQSRRKKVSEQTQNRDRNSKLETRNSKLKTVSLAPNPANDRVRIGLTDLAGETATVSIYNDLGRLIWEQRVQGEEELQINLRQAGVTAGLYTVRVQAADQVVAKRLVVRE
jgi:hypothetical protein